MKKSLEKRHPTPTRDPFAIYAESEVVFSNVNAVVYKNGGSGSGVFIGNGIDERNRPVGLVMTNRHVAKSAASHNAAVYRVFDKHCQEYIDYPVALFHYITPENLTSDIDMNRDVTQAESDDISDFAILVLDRPVTDLKGIKPFCKSTLESRPTFTQVGITPWNRSSIHDTDFAYPTDQLKRIASKFRPGFFTGKPEALEMIHTVHDFYLDEGPKDILEAATIRGMSGGMVYCEQTRAFIGMPATVSYPETYRFLDKNSKFRKKLTRPYPDRIESFLFNWDKFKFEKSIDWGFPIQIKMKNRSSNYILFHKYRSEIQAILQDYQIKVEIDPVDSKPTLGL